MKPSANPARQPPDTSPKPTSERNRYSTPRRAGASRNTANWDSQPWRPRFQQLLFTIAGLALLPAIAATLMRVLPPAEEPTVQLAAFIPYGLVGYLLALSCLLVALVRARRRLSPP